jgi:hypothetical protein
MSSRISDQCTLNKTSAITHSEYLQIHPAHLIYKELNKELMDKIRYDRSGFKGRYAAPVDVGLAGHFSRSFSASMTPISENPSFRHAF